MKSDQSKSDIHVAWIRWVKWKIAISLWHNTIVGVIIMVFILSFCLTELSPLFIRPRKYFIVISILLEEEDKITDSYETLIAVLQLFKVQQISSFDRKKTNSVPT